MIKNIIKRIPFLYDIASNIMKLSRKDIFCHQLKIINKGNSYVRLRKYIDGNNNYIEIGKNCHIAKTSIHIVGNNNRLIFKDKCQVGEKCSFWMEGNNIKIEIGAGTTFTHTVHFCAQEDNSVIMVGEDCMFSNTITVRTSDSHPIYDLRTHERINFAKNVIVGSHVWVAPNTKIMKGAKIGDNSIVGSNTMVNNEIPCNCLAVGTPCKVVKSNVSWTRERIF